MRACPRGSPVGDVKAIGPIQMRRPDAQSGEKLVGIPVPISNNYFLIGLMRGDPEKRNIQVLRSLSVIDLPFQFADGRLATINLLKGPTGDRIFAEVKRRPLYIVGESVGFDETVQELPRPALVRRPA